MRQRPTTTVTIVISNISNDLRPVMRTFRGRFVERMLKATGKTYEQKFHRHGLNAKSFIESFL
jgi:hypothetical protein